ncbi:MAG TPA: CHRD domain-containing protein [Allosphingosinicella sp.]|nr:CHRD domain-containing protein [Allosphingosinicella sp.]
MLKLKPRMLLTAFGGLCMLTAPAGAAMAAKFQAVLNGDKELVPGDADGWGRARIRIDDSLNRLCADLEVRSVTKVTSAHIFRGAAGEQGTPVVKLDTPDDDDSDDCDAIGDTLADEIQANPAGFYVSITTLEHPKGALRGQLAPGGD